MMSKSYKNNVKAMRAIIEFSYNNIYISNNQWGPEVFR